MSLKIEEDVDGGFGNGEEFIKLGFRFLESIVSSI